MDLLRLTTAGSVDDGKSTLIGRLLYDTGAVYQDQLNQIKKISERKGIFPLDFSLITDGLAAEREQGITIDVAYRYFATPKRKYIIADVPGHEQYTRNMVTGASTAQLALILIDARKGLLIQSKRHLVIASLLGIRHVLIVINKMDAVHYSEMVFDNIRSDCRNFCAKLDIDDLQFIPVSALQGDMVVERGVNLSWYGGRTLMDYLENLEIASDKNLIDFRFPVQSVIRPNQDFRGYTGKITSGTINAGEGVVMLPSMQKAVIKSIIIDNREAASATTPESVTMTLDREVDVSRGMMIAREKNLPSVGNKLNAMVCWLDSSALKFDYRYIIKHTTKSSPCFFQNLLYRLDIDTLERDTDRTELELNDIGRVVITTTEPLMFDTYRQNKDTGSFIIIDPLTGATAAAGIIRGDKAPDTADPSADTEKDIAQGGIFVGSSLPQDVRTAVARIIADYTRTNHIPFEDLSAARMRTFDELKNIHDVEMQTWIPILASMLSQKGVVVFTDIPCQTRSPKRMVRVCEDAHMSISPESSESDIAKVVLGHLKKCGIIR